MAVSDSEPQPVGLNGPAEALAIVCASVTTTRKRRLLLQSGKMKKLTSFHSHSLMTIQSAKRKKGKKSLQHLVFPGGLPSKY